VWSTPLGLLEDVTDTCTNIEPVAKEEDVRERNMTIRSEI
jgi:hypothetical protein